MSSLEYGLTCSTDSLVVGNALQGLAGMYRGQAIACAVCVALQQMLSPLTVVCSLFSLPRSHMACRRHTAHAITLFLQV